MAVTSTRTINITMTGDVVAQVAPAAASNATAPGKIDIVTLASGANTITPPTGAVGCTVLPPSGNTTSIIFKGVTGDTGLRMHNTDPFSITLNAASDTFVLTAGAQITSVRFYWT